MEDKFKPKTMEFAHLLNKDYAATVGVEKPDNLCQHMVKYICQELFDKKKHLPASFVKKILEEVTPLFLSLSNVIAVNRQQEYVTQSQFSGRVTVIGDLHGQFRDLAYLLSPDGPISFPNQDNQIIVNGDMVDRGDMSVEIIAILSLISLMVPGSVHMLKGNHEAAPHLTTSFGFDDEVKLKYPGDLEMKHLFRQLFQALPIAAVVDDSVFVVHGGLGRLTKTIADINKVPSRSKLEPMLYELVWNGKKMLVLLNHTIKSEL